MAKKEKNKRDVSGSAAPKAVGSLMKFLLLFKPVKELFQANETLKRDMMLLYNKLNDSRAEIRAVRRENERLNGELAAAPKKVDEEIEWHCREINKLNDQVLKEKYKIEDLKINVSKLTAEIEQLKRDNTNLETQLIEAQAEKQCLQKELDEFKDFNTDVISVVDLQYQLAAAEKDKAIAEADEERLKAQLEEERIMHRDAVAKMIKAHEEEIAKLNAELRAESDVLAPAFDVANGRADSLFDAYAELLKGLMNDTLTELSNAYPAGKDDVIGHLISSILTENDTISIADFCERHFMPVFDKIEEKSVHGLGAKLREEYKNLLKPLRPTWLDALMRLDAMLNVPFIAQQYADKGLDINAVHRASDNVRRLLAVQGIRLDVPRLFVDKFDSYKHNAQSIKDIAKQVEDIGSHVPDAETIIDVFTLGYHSDDNEFSRRPAVVFGTIKKSTENK